MQQMTGKSEHLGRSGARPTVASLLVVLVICAPCGKAQRPAPSSFAPIAVRPEADLQRSWEVEQGGLEENFDSATFTATIKNVSGQPVASAYFFGRYYDASNRLCFTALFSLGDNGEGRTGPAMPGEVRTLRSVSLILPAIKPNVVDLSLSKRVRVPGRSPVPAVLAAPLTPVMIVGVDGITGPDDWGRLCLGGKPGVPDRAVVDVALAKARITSDSKMEDFEVLDALATEPFVTWFTELASHLAFDPASRNGQPFASEVLLLARVVVRAWNPGEPPHLARSNPWVKRAVGGLAGTPLAPVIPVMLYDLPSGGLDERPSSEVGPCFEYGNGGTAWSAGFPYVLPPVPSAVP